MAEEGQRGGYSRLAGDEEVATASGGGGGDYDERKLRLLGYEPQLKRNLSYVPPPPHHPPYSSRSRSLRSARSSIRFDSRGRIILLNLRLIEALR